MTTRPTHTHGPEHGTCAACELEHEATEVTSEDVARMRGITLEEQLADEAKERADWDEHAAGQAREERAQVRPLRP